MRPQSARVAIDLETTGLHPELDAIIEIGAVKFVGRDVVETFANFVSPGMPLPFRVQRLTGIMPRDLRNAPTLTMLAPRLRAFLGDAPLVGHSVPFDAAFLRRSGLATRNPLIDTFELASMLLPNLPSYTLASVGKALNVQATTYHRALADAELSREVFLALLDRLDTLDSAALDMLATLDAPPDWTPRFFVRSQARAVSEASATSPFAGLLKAALGDQLAAKRGVDPAALSMTVALEPDRPLTLAAPVAETTETTETTEAAPASQAVSDGGAAVTNAASGADGAARARLARQAGVQARVATGLAANGVVSLIEVERGEDGLLACLAPVVAHAAQTGERVIVSAADGEQMRRVAYALLPHAATLAHLTAEDAGRLHVALLDEQEGYLCLHRWFGAARQSAGAPFAQDVARGLAKLTVWSRTTATGLRAEVALAGQETLAWERTRAGREFAGTMAECPYRREGYCFLTRAEEAAAAAQIVVTTHAMLAQQFTSATPTGATGDEKHRLPGANRLLVLDAHLLEDELRRAGSFALDWQETQRLLDRLGAVDAQGESGGLLRLVAEQLDPANAARSADVSTKKRAKSQQADQPTRRPSEQERAWFELVAQARHSGQTFFLALGDVLSEAQSEHVRAMGQPRNEQQDTHVLRLDAHTRGLTTWRQAGAAWAALDARLAVLANALREAAQAISSAPAADEGVAYGLMTDLLGMAWRLDDLRAQATTLLGDGAAEARGDAVVWLRIPYTQDATGDRRDSWRRNRSSDQRNGRDRSARQPGKPQSAPQPASQSRNTTAEAIITPGMQARDSSAEETAEAPQEELAAAQQAGQSSGQPAGQQEQADQPEIEVPALYRAPIRVGQRLAPLWSEGRSLTLTGWALSVGGEFDFTRAMLSLPESATSFPLLPDYAQQTLLCLPDDAPEPNAPHYQQRLDEALIALAVELGGQMVVIFPSHAALRAGAMGVRRALERNDILTLAQGIDGSARQLWQTFYAQPRTVLLGAGSFWDGAEQHGTPPACVVAPRLPFPALSDPVQAARSELWSDPQSQFVVPQATLKLRQALGGLAWSHQRRNVVVLFDRRIQTRSYGPTVLGALPRCAQAQEPMAQLVERAAEWVRSY